MPLLLPTIIFLLFVVVGVGGSEFVIGLDVGNEAVDDNDETLPLQSLAEVFFFDLLTLRHNLWKDESFFNVFLLISFLSVMEEAKKIIEEAVALSSFVDKVVMFEVAVVFSLIGLLILNEEVV